MQFDITGVLFPNLLTMLVQLCATLVLFLLCKKLLWVPARKILKARQDKMVSDLDDAKRLQEEAGVKLDDAKKALEEARDKSGEIIENAKTEANNLRDEILAAAKKQADDKLDIAQKKIEQSKLEAKQEIHDEMVDVALEAVSKLLNDKSTTKDDEETIKKYIKEVEDKK